MSVSDEDIAHVKDIFSELGAIQTRKMMGGLAIYFDGTIFALLHSSGQIYLKGAGSFVKELEEMGASRWSYTKKGSDKLVYMPYWSLPDSALDDPREAASLARSALAEIQPS